MLSCLCDVCGTNFKTSAQDQVVQCKCTRSDCASVVLVTTSGASTQDAHALCKQMGPVDVNGHSTLHVSNIKGFAFEFVLAYMCGLGLS